MHQIKNVTIKLDEVDNIKKTDAGLVFSFIEGGIIDARGAKFSDIVNAIDIEVLQDMAVKVKDECGFKVFYS